MTIVIVILTQMTVLFEIVNNSVAVADAGITINGENVRLMVIRCIRPLLGN